MFTLTICPVIYILLGNLDHRMEAIKLQAFAPNTLKTRRSQWNRYHKFCDQFLLPALPVTPQTVCRFLVYVGDGLSYTSLNNYVSALNILGRFDNSGFDLRTDFSVSLLLRGFKRIKGDVSSPKDPLLPTDLKRIYGQVNLDIDTHLVVWVIILLAFRSLLRKSHFVSSSSEDRDHLLLVKDVTFEPWGCILHIRSSKTIQFGERSFDIPVSYSAPPLCAATVLKSYLEKENLQCSDFLFSLPGSRGKTPMPYNISLDLLKAWCKQADITKDVGFHSLRRGAASFMHSLDIELVSIQKAGDWQSLCVLDYLTVDFEQKRKVESLVSSSL